MARKGGNPTPLLVRVCEEERLKTLGLNEAEDSPLPEWAIRVIMLKGVSKRNKSALMLAHNRRILSYKAQQAK